jgi:hypothetical protein
MRSTLCRSSSSLRLSAAHFLGARPLSSSSYGFLPQFGRVLGNSKRPIFPSLGHYPSRRPITTYTPVLVLVPTAAACFLAQTTSAESPSSQVLSTRLFSPHETSALVTSKKKQNKFHINRPLVVRSLWDKILFAILIPLTAGLALLFIKPLLEFRHYCRAISKMRIDGRRVKFTGELGEYILLYLQNMVLTIVTFGIYGLLGYPERKIAAYVDAHMDWDDTPQVVPYVEKEVPKVL